VDNFLEGDDETPAKRKEDPMTTANDYLKAAIDHLPRASNARARIEMELRALVGEQLERGRTLEEISRQLGDPKALAESYLSATPLVAAPLFRRIGAKFLDIAFIVMALVPALGLAGLTLTSEFAALVVVAGLVGGTVGFGIGTIGMEYWLGQTPGKRLLGLQVVRESGAAISLGQAVARQLPMVFQFYWVDVLFAFFTDRQQRAFELLSKTRVVMADQTAERESRREDLPNHA
jgi:uncharacterized RDD family membrane protein YckC